MSRRPVRALAATVLLAAGAAAVLASRMRGGPQPGGDEPQAEPAVLATLAGWQPRRPHGLVARAVAYAWAAPNTAAGLLLAALSGGRARIVDGVLVVSGIDGPLAAMLRHRGFSATTLGHVVLARDEPSARLLAHELAHTRQAERLGPVFGPLYLALLARYGYRRHPLERAARAAAQRSSGGIPPGGSVAAAPEAGSVPDHGPS